MQIFVRTKIMQIFVLSGGGARETDDDDEG
jgi:hypothetical protein